MLQDSAQVQPNPKLIGLADTLRGRAEKLDLLVTRLDGLKNRLTGVGMAPYESEKEPVPSGIVGGLESTIRNISIHLDRFEEIMSGLEGIS